MLRKSAYLHRLTKDEHGVTAIEFALISPVFLFMLMGTFDIGYAIYMRSTLNGAVQLAARDSSLQDATDDTARAAIDNKVRGIIQQINRNATVTIDRKNYSDYNDVQKKEEYDDDNGNGTCDNSEAFDDINANDTWDNVGKSGIGGARDSVLYSITVSYNTLFPFSGYDRTAKGKKIVGYETRQRQKFVTVPGAVRTYKLPIYANDSATPSKAGMEINVPVFDNVQVATVKRTVPQFENYKVALPRNRPPTFETPVFKLVPDGVRKHKIPITEIVEVKRSSTVKPVVQVPIYEFVVITRDRMKNVVEYEAVEVPVYMNVVTQTAKGPRLDRVLVRNETIRRPKLETKRAVTNGTKQVVERRIVGYQTVSKPMNMLQRKVIGFDYLEIPTYKRVITGTATVKRATHIMKRRLLGYKTIDIPVMERRFVRYETVKRPLSSIKRRLVGYKAVVKRLPPTRVAAGTQNYLVPKYQNANASFGLAGISNNRTMTGQTLLKNQPYGDQAARAPTPGNCDD